MKMGMKMLAMMMAVCCDMAYWFLYRLLSCVPMNPNAPEQYRQKNTRNVLSKPKDEGS